MLLLKGLSVLWRAIGDPFWALLSKVGNTAELAELAGTVTSKHRYDRHDPESTLNFQPYTDFYITVSRTEFKVSRRLFDSVKVGDEVILNLKFGELSSLGGVLLDAAEISSITRGTSPAAQEQLSALEAQRVAEERSELARKRSEWRDVARLV